jgi:hypothetical protein
MSRAQKIRAAVLAQCDPRIRAVLHGEGTTVDEIGPWSREGTTESLIGADLTLKLDRPTTLEADWKFVKFAADGSYRQGTAFHYRAERVTELEVYVDVTKDEVVAFAPLDGDTVESTVYPIGASHRSDSSDMPVWEVILFTSGSVVALLLVAWFTRRVAMSRGIS